MRKIWALPLLALGLAACDGAPAVVSETVDPARLVTAQAAPSGPGAEAVAAARQACADAIARPGDAIRVEHERPASGGAMVILHVRRGADATTSERWRCGFEAATGRVVANNVS